MRVLLLFSIESVINHDKVSLTTIMDIYRLIFDLELKADAGEPRALASAFSSSAG